MVAAVVAAAVVAAAMVGEVAPSGRESERRSECDGDSSNRTHEGLLLPVGPALFGRTRGCRATLPASHGAIGVGSRP